MTESNASQPQVTKHESQYTIAVEGQEAGFAAFKQSGTTRDFNHTVIHPQFQGQGLSKPLIKAALDDSRAQGFTVVPTCSAVEGFIKKNPDYANLVK